VKRKLFVFGSLIILLTCGGGPETETAEATPPNVIFLLLDDMGYADIGAYGNTYHKTPNIDRLAADGMRFTDAYAAAPNCSPTRGSILTGRWPARTGVTQYLPGNVLEYAKLLQAELPKGLPLEETVIAEPLSKAGYATASIGKWHLGGGRYLPENRGFDLNFAGGHWNAHQSMFAPHPFVEVPEAQPGDFLTDRLTLEAEKFIDANHDRPFFLYLPYYAVHGPVQAKEELIAGYEGREDPSGRNNQKYAAMTESVDESVGRLVAKLKELGLTENTVIFFFSDNGGVPRVAFNGGFRSGKGFLWEGGIREPLIVKWPGVVAAGSVCETPVTSVDFYSTILEMAGAADVAGHTVDGANLMPLLRQSGEWERDTIYWHYPHYANAGSTPTGAIRQGDWKLMEFFEDGHVELYNLADDPAEEKDLAAVEGERARAMQRRLAEWRESVGARPALPNPQHDPARAKQRYGIGYKAAWDEADPFRPRKKN
jgi:arylsulfatase A